MPAHISGLKTLIFTYVNIETFLFQQFPLPIAQLSSPSKHQSGSPGESHLDHNQKTCHSTGLVRFMRSTLPDAETCPPKSTRSQNVPAPEGCWRENLRNGNCLDSRRLLPF